MNSTFFFEKGVVMKKQFDERNLTMVMDFYELTMANGYFKDEDKERKVAFDVFYRKNPDMPDMLYLQVLNRLLNILRICILMRTTLNT